VPLGDRWTHLLVHSDITASSVQALTDHYTFVNKSFVERIEQSQYIFITLGSAWHFRHKDSDQIVANCHKQPADQFERMLSPPDHIIKELSDGIQTLRSINPQLNVVLTVSPVRHIRDGLIANSRSKAHLLTAVHYIIEQFDNAHYYPAYEMLIDDLRDYRYYDRDLIHPSATAVDYIWDHLMQHHMSSSTQGVVKKVAVIDKHISHRPFDPTSSAHQNFLQKLRDQILVVQETHQLNYKKELDYIDRRLDKFGA